jgi:hypothetical protein
MSSASRKKTRPAARPKTKARPKPPAKPVPKKAVKAKPRPKPAAKPKAKVPPKPAARPAVKVAAPAKAAVPAKAATPAKATAPTKATLPVKGKPPLVPAKAGAPGVPARQGSSKKSARRSIPTLRRGPDGQPLQPGELLLPGGPQNLEEILYLFRGVIASQRVGGEVAIGEVVAKRPAGDPLAARPELERHYSLAQQRFSSGSIENTLPNRAQPKLTFQGFVERARQRRREIGGFLRGLDIGKTESSQMDAHGEDSLNKLMEWAARLEKAMDADEPAQADYSHFHRGLDVFDERTESLVVDLEKTLRRLGARVKP